MGSPHVPDPAERLLTPANIITLVRICLVPVFVVALLSPWPTWIGLDDLITVHTKSLVAAVVFVVISCTDWIDGYLARSRNEVTNFGKFMDPLADKILVAAALLALVELSVLPSWPVLIILVREFIVSGVRMVAASKGEVIAASWYGKAKTVLQIIAIVMFLVKDSLYLPTFNDMIASPMYLLSWLAMIIALVLTIVSMLDYLVKARHLLGFGTGSAKDASGGQRACVAPEADGRRSQSGCEEPSENGRSNAGADGRGALDELDALLAQKARQVVEAAVRTHTTIATAESLTGGMIAACLTSVPGSSAVVRGGVVSYASDVKRDVLGVSADALSAQGAVCEDVARAMAAGARDALDADLAVAVTGIAGPGGAEAGKPVGTVWLALDAGGVAEASLHLFAGDREQVRRQTALAALEALASKLDSNEAIE